jgi:hypothetical protein
MVCGALTALCVVFLSWPSSYRLKCRTVNGRAFEPNHAGEALSRRRIEVLGRNVRRITLRSAKNPIAIYYEHPRWFQPVFDELERRGVPYVRLDASRHHFGLVPNGNQQFGLVFNRMSPSAWTRGHANAIFYTLSYLAHLERMGALLLLQFSPQMEEMDRFSEQVIKPHTFRVAAM